MKPERWHQIQHLYNQALEVEESQRSGFLREACAGDDDLRQDLEELFAEDPQVVSFLETPALREIAPEFAAASTIAWVGRQIGNYQFVSLLGTGGMGEVYRARDSNLKRDVAIKVLPDAFSRDAERVARFQREAQMLASLNHPHIGAIYDLKKFEESQFLVLELVEGETLAERIARRPISSHDALPIAKQIAEALEAAHAKAIIHRDLKPSNIKVTPDGTVKVLDFGLAEIWEKETTAASASDVAMTITASSPGAILGTAAYICPERAHGKPVDKRTDLWAFGCVLYEMLTGRPAFPGDTVSGTVAGILERDPDWGALPAATPSSIVRLLRRCLDKDPKRRLHDIADARIEIEDAISGASLTPAETAVVDRRPVRLLWPIVAVFSVMALIALGVRTWYMRTPPRTSRLTMATSSATALRQQGNGRSLAITPDGTRVIYVGSSNQLFVRPLDQYDAIAIFTGAAPLTWIFVSPDGQWVGFAEANALKKVPISGGKDVTIAQTSHTPAGAMWTPENDIIFATTDPSTGLQRISADGGAVTVLTWPDQARSELDHFWPEMLPGGRKVLFTITDSTGGLGAAQVAVLDLATGKYQGLWVGSHAHYVPSGHLVYAVDRTLRAVPFDLNRLETRGTPVALPGLLTSPQGAANLAIAADGTLAYVDAPGAAAAGTLMWVDREGREEPLGAPARPYFHPRLSWDGKQVAVAIENQYSDIWLWDLARHTLDQRTFDPGPDMAPVWTTDGRHLIFFSPRDGAQGLFWQSPDGNGGAERLGTGIPSGVTQDDKHVILYLDAKDIMMMALDGTRRVEPLVKTSSIERNGVVSSDGHWLAYESDSPGGPFEIYVRPFPDVKAGLWKISAAGGTRPLWSRNGHELFYVAPDGALMAGRFDPRGGVFVKVVEARYATTGPRPGRTYDVSLDDQRFLVIKPLAANEAGAPEIRIVHGWFAELKRLVPVN